VPILQHLFVLVKVHHAHAPRTLASHPARASTSVTHTRPPAPSPSHPLPLTLSPSHKRPPARHV
jgi:hypothetical protein